MTSREYAEKLTHHLNFFICVVLIIGTTMTTALCPSECLCTDDGSERATFVNCRSKGLTGMISNIPTDVIELDLSDNPILNISRSSFPSLPKLRRLLMENCGLDRLVRLTFRNLELLEILKLSRNRIRSIDDSAFQGLPNLRQLFIDDNQLDALPDYLFRSLTLDSLTLNGNKLLNIPSELFQASLIKELDLGRNRIDRLDSFSLLPLEKSLRTLIVNNNHRSLIISDDIVGLVNVNRTLKIDDSTLIYDAFDSFNFTSLSIVASNLTDVTFLTHLTAERLDLSSNYFPRSMRFPVSSSLASSCRYLKLSDSNLFLFPSSLASSLRSVLSIDMSRNGLTSLDGATIFEAIPNLLSLDLSGNPFETTSLQDDFSTSLINLRTLNLSRCGLTSVSSGLFRGADQLQKIDLSFNRLQIVSKSLEPYLNSISLVDLTGNPLHCNCENLWFRKWLSTESRNNVGVVRCRTPLDKRDGGDDEDGMGTDVLSRSEGEFRCTEPQITQITYNQNVDEGTDFLLNCVAQSDPAADVVWTSPFGESFRITPPDDRMQNRTTAIWQIRRVRTTQTGWYGCSATNLVSTTTRYAYMHVVTSLTPPAEFEGLEYPDVPGPLKTRRPSSAFTQQPTTLTDTTSVISRYDTATSGSRKSIQYLYNELDTTTSETTVSTNQVQTPLTVVASEMRDLTTSNKDDVQGNSFSMIVGVCVIVTLAIIIIVIVVVIVICCRRKHRRNKRYSVRRKTLESLNGDQPSRNGDSGHGRKSTSSERMPLSEHTMLSDTSLLKDQSYSSNQSV